MKNSGSLQFDELAIGESESQSRDADNTTSNLYNSGGIPGYSSSTNRYGGGIQPTTSSYDLVTQEATGEHTTAAAASHLSVLLRENNIESNKHANFTTYVVPVGIVRL